MTAPPEGTTRFVRVGYPLMGLGLFLLYLPTLARGATFSDGPELVAAVHSLGVAHPTGYPVFILTAHAFAWLLRLPILYCVKVEIYNALCVAIGCVLTAYTARALTRKCLEPNDAPRLADWAGLAVAILLGVSTMLWGQLHIPEVYPLHFLLVAWAGYLWMRFEDTRRERYILMAALPMGLGLAHHVTMIYMLPAAFLYLVVRRPVFFVAWITTPAQHVIRLFKPSFREGKPLAATWPLWAACVIGFLPLLSYSYLIWANNHSAGVPWGDCNGWDNLYNHFTGKQYMGFMHKLDLVGHLNRIKVIPDIFDQQFLPVGTVLLFAGLQVSFRRAPGVMTFFSSYLLFNAAHGVHYAVGDYGTYYIPGFYCCAIIMAPGFAWLISFARARPPEARVWLGLLTLGLMLATWAVTVSIYAHFTKRLPPLLAAHRWWFVVPVGVLAVASLVAAWITYRDLRAGRRPLFLQRLSPALADLELPDRALPLLLVGGALSAVVPATIWRATELMREALIGESYGAELATQIPPGSILLTQGDGYLFTMWYEQHVHARGMDFAVVDTGNIRTPWYIRYVKTHHPVTCDVFGPLDPAARAAKCDTFDKRLALKEKDTWISLDLVGNRKPFPGVAGAHHEILRGDDPRCSEKKFKEEHIGKECRCYGFGESPAAQEAVLEEDCAYSAEERGVVPHAPVEIYAQRILEDYLDERPVFERNVLTNWAGTTDNPRGWDGPQYQRPSADYALINRGRYNQLVWYHDIEGFDPCAGDALRELPQRALSKPRRTPRGAARRRLYKPNDRPTLLTASYLVSTRDGRDDDATRELVAGQPIFAKLEWFEKFNWNKDKPDKRGAPINHGVRLCVFDPDGHKVATQMTMSGPAQHDPVALFKAAPAKAGAYRLRACTVGEVTPGKLAEAEDRACKWAVLDYGFTVKAGRR